MRLQKKIAKNKKTKGGRAPLLAFIFGVTAIGSIFIAIIMAFFFSATLLGAIIGTVFSGIASYSSIGAIISGIIGLKGSEGRDRTFSLLGLIIGAILIVFSLIFGVIAIWLYVNGII